MDLLFLLGSDTVSRLSVVLSKDEMMLVSDNCLLQSLLGYIMITLAQIFDGNFVDSSSVEDGAFFN